MPDIQSRRYYPALDGIRGLAILLVVFYHNFGFINHFFFGWLGVDLFFVLSGYLITNILLDTVGDKHYLKKFYVRRVLRIFPLYYLVLIVFLWILPNIRAYSINMEYYQNNQAWLWTYLQNWLYIFRPPENSDILMHLWSLAVEEQFYLVWPFIILLVRRPKHLLIIMLSALLLVMVLRSFLWFYKVENLIYSSLYTYSRIDGICIGCSVALIQRINYDFLRNRLSIIVLSLAALNFIFFFLNRSNQFNYPYLAFIGYTTLAAIFGILVYETVRNENPLINFVFTFRPLVFLGRISYGFYIFHWPVYLLTAGYFQQKMERLFANSLSQVLASIISTLLALVISIASYYLFEIRFLRLKNRFSYARPPALERPER